MTLDAVVAGLFDYAGMFPPASLSFTDALRESAEAPVRLRRPGMVAADMVITPEQLAALDPVAVQGAGFEGGRALNACLVGISIDQAVAMAETVAAWNQGYDGHPVPQRIISIEVHAEGELDNEAAVAEILAETREIVGGDVRVFFEPKWTDEQWGEGDNAGHVFGILDRLNGEGWPVGLKVRCAGPHALSHGTLASIFPQLAERNIPFKATQGLHFPVAGTEGYAHGFLNLAVALRLAQADADPDAVLGCLMETHAEAFVFGNEIGWRGDRIPADELAAMHEAVPFQIGSCSLRDPDDGLAALYD